MTAVVQLGAVIRGKYRVESVLGEGGMGVVVAARHVTLAQRVAIKLLKPALLAQPSIVERFVREAQAASRIESDHVARVLDVDTLHDGTPFMVMEHLDGADLSYVRRGGRGLPVPVAITYVLEACAAIGEAHRIGIVHRDIKPANLFLAKRPDGRTRVKVLDFGISKLIGAASDGKPSMTETSVVMGSAEYMSPEQMISTRDTDARTDIWAIGVTLYELLTARVPFPGDTLTQVCALVMSAQPEPPSALRPDLPPGLGDVILRCLEKDRERRYASIDHLVTALVPYARAPEASSGATVILSKPAEVAPATVPAATGSTRSAVSRDLAPPRRSPAGPLAIAGAAVIAIAAAIAFAGARGRPEARPEAAPPALPVAAAPITPAPPATADEPVVTPRADPDAGGPVATTTPPKPKPRLPQPVAKPPPVKPAAGDAHTID